MPNLQAWTSFKSGMTRIDPANKIKAIKITAIFIALYFKIKLDTNNIQGFYCAMAASTFSVSFRKSSILP